MSDLGTMITRITREIKRDGLTASIKDAIITSITNHEEERFTFNEDDATAQASSGVESISFPTNMLHVDRVELSSTSSDRYALHSTFLDNIRRGTIDSASSGQPDAYAVFNERIYFNTPLDRDYEVRAWGHVSLTEISASATSASTNAWMTTGEDLIRNAAKSLVYSGTLRNDRSAAVADHAAARAQRRLENKYAMQVSTGRVQKTSW